MKSHFVSIVLIVLVCVSCGYGESSAQSSQDSMTKHIYKPAIDPDNFVALEQEPTPLQPLQSLVVYPQVAIDSNMQGKVIVRMLVRKDGSVQKVEVDRSVNPILDSAAIQAMMKAKFTPAKQNGQPVKVWYETPIIFKLIRSN